ncbi:unnamed protein product [Tilletia controversa]|nr:unnamed protein product [Tilletia controversa]CAD6925916.1 unnamed protein product [Tilletia controversa]CAD6925923.1 unnamed protein product [Tilletia controversa]CAD6983084.1 unnamed protein product [Tilletia controversa]
MEYVERAQVQAQVQARHNSFSLEDNAQGPITSSPLGSLSPPVGSVHFSRNAADLSAVTLQRRRVLARGQSLDRTSARNLLDSYWPGPPSMSRGLDASFDLDARELAQPQLEHQMSTYSRHNHQAVRSARAQGQHRVDRSRTGSHDQEERSYEILGLIDRRDEIATKQTNSTQLDKLPQTKNGTTGIPGSTGVLSPLPPLLAVDPNPSSAFSKANPHWMLFYGSHVQDNGASEAGVFAVNVDSQSQSIDAMSDSHSPTSSPVQPGPLAPARFFSFQAPANDASPQSFHDWLSNLGGEAGAAGSEQQGGASVSPDGSGAQMPAWGPNPLVNPADAAGNVGGSPTNDPVPASGSALAPSSNTAGAAPPASVATVAPTAQPEPTMVTPPVSIGDPTDSGLTSTFTPRTFPSRSASSTAAAPTNGTGPPPPVTEDSQDHPRRHIAAIVLGTFAGAAFVVILGAYAYRQRKQQTDRASIHSGEDDPYTSTSGGYVRTWSQRRRGEMGSSYPADLEKGKMSPSDDRFSLVDDLPPVPPKARSIVSTIRAVPRGQSMAERRGSLPLLPELEVSPRTRMQELSNLAKPRSPPAVVPAQKRVPVPAAGSLGSRTNTLSASSSEGYSSDDYTSVAEYQSTRRSTASTQSPKSDHVRPGLARGISKQSDDRGSLSGQSKVSHISYPFLSAMHRGRSIASVGSPLVSRDDSAIMTTASPNLRSMGTMSDKTGRLLRNLKTRSSPTMSGLSVVHPSMSEVMAQGDQPESPYMGSVASGPTASLDSRHEGATTEAMQTLRNAVFPLPPTRTFDPNLLTPLDGSSSVPRKQSGGSGGVQRTPSLAGIGAGFRYGSAARHFISLLAGPVLAGHGKANSTSSASSNAAHQQQQQQQMKPPATPMTFTSPMFPWDPSGTFVSPNPQVQTPRPEVKETARRSRGEMEQAPATASAKQQRASQLRVTNLE